MFSYVTAFFRFFFLCSSFPCFTINRIDEEANSTFTVKCHESFSHFWESIYGSLAVTCIVRFILLLSTYHISVCLCMSVCLSVYLPPPPPPSLFLSHSLSLSSCAPMPICIYFWKIFGLNKLRISKTKTAYCLAVVFVSLRITAAAIL